MTTTTTTKRDELVAEVVQDLKDRTIYRLADDAGCAGPDSHTSPGALLLDGVRDGVVELIESDPETFADLAAADDIGAMDDGGSVHEIADGAPSLYTSTMWDEFHDLGAYQEDPSELGDPDGHDMNRLAAICLFQIADRLARGLLDEAAEEYRDAVAELDDEDEDE